MPLRNLYLEIVVFFSGAFIMALELCGSRIFAPFFGSSIEVWTSLIAIVMASLSAGYWWGGKLADRRLSKHDLSLLLLGAAVFIIPIALFEYPILKLLNKLNLGYIFTLLVAAIALFAIPSSLLAATLPYVIRYRLSEISQSGGTIGRLFALSTIGSLLGVFLFGFFFIPTFGSNFLLLVIAAGLVFLALPITNFSAFSKFSVVVLVGLVFCAQYYINHLLISRGTRIIDTVYNRAVVLDITNSNAPLRYLFTGPHTPQTRMFLEDPLKLSLKVLDYVDLGFELLPAADKLLLLGGGGYTYPKYFVNKYPHKKMDVIELDPGITKIAKQFFYLEAENNLRIIHEDARVFLNKTALQYDLIIMDVFSGSVSIPFYLLTKEASQQIYQGLAANGILFVNLFAATEGPASQLLQAYYWTLRSVFPQVYILSLGQAPEKKQLRLLVASKSPEPLAWEKLNEPTKSLIAKDLHRNNIPDNGTILTDDYAPVEYLYRAHGWGH